MQQLADVGAEHDRHENGRADERDGEEDLEGGFRDELNHDRRPIRRSEKRAAFEEELEVQNSFTNCMLSST